MDVALRPISPRDDRQRLSGCPSARLSVLVVDDDPTFGTLLAERMRDCGHDAGLATNGAEAIAQVAARRPDLVLLDHEMPVMDGVTAARRIRDLPGCADLPLVMISGRSDAGARGEAAAAGIRHYLPKPVSLPALDRLLDDIAAALPREGAS